MNSTGQLERIVIGVGPTAGKPISATRIGNISPELPFCAIPNVRWRDNGVTFVLDTYFNGSWLEVPLVSDNPAPPNEPTQLKGPNDSYEYLNNTDSQPEVDRVDGDAPNKPMSKLQHDIQHAINCASAENGSDTPDFILAEYLTDCLVAYDRATSAREKWYGRTCGRGELSVDPSLQQYCC